MRTVRARRAHRGGYEVPLVLCAGERLDLGRTDWEFPGWRWVRSVSGAEGWAPVAVLDEGALPPRARENYDATELDVDPGDEIQVLDERNGWLRVRAGDAGIGWIPVACVDGDDDPGPVLTTSRLTLRPMRRDDGAALIEFYASAEVMAIRKFGVMDRKQALASLETILDHWRRHGFGLWVVTEAGEGAFIGECGLRWLEDGSDVELSYGLYPSYRGRGYATEAATAAIRFGFETLGLPRIVALSRGDNAASHRVLDKCGMRLAQRWARAPAGLVKYVIERG